MANPTGRGGFKTDKSEVGRASSQA